MIGNWHLIYEIRYHERTHIPVPLDKNTYQNNKFRKESSLYIVGLVEWIAIGIKPLHYNFWAWENYQWMRMQFIEVSFRAVAFEQEFRLKDQVQGVYLSSLFLKMGIPLGGVNNET